MKILKRLLEYNYKLKNKDYQFYKKLGVNFLGDDVSILNSNLDENYPYLLTIGNHVTITNSSVLTHDASTLRPLGYTKVGKVCIGNNVFVGYNSLIMPGSHIGNNVIIGAGSIVRGDVEDNSVVAGNPLRKICTYDEFVQKHSEEVAKNCFEAETNSDDVEKLKSYLDSNKFSYSK